MHSPPISATNHVASSTGPWGSVRTATSLKRLWSSRNPTLVRRSLAITAKILCSFSAVLKMIAVNSFTKTRVPTRWAIRSFVRSANMNIGRSPVHAVEMSKSTRTQSFIRVFRAINASAVGRSWFILIVLAATNLSFTLTDSKLGKGRDAVTAKFGENTFPVRSAASLSKEKTSAFINLLTAATATFISSTANVPLAVQRSASTS